MISRQDVYVDDKGRTILSLTELSAGVPIGEPRFIADLVYTVEAGPVKMQITVRADLPGPTPEDAFAGIPEAYEAGKPKAVEAAEKQLAQMAEQQQAEARKIITPGITPAGRMAHTNGNGHGLRLRP